MFLFYFAQNESKKNSKKLSSENFWGVGVPIIKLMQGPTEIHSMGRAHPVKILLLLVVVVVFSSINVHMLA